MSVCVCVGGGVGEGVEKGIDEYGFKSSRSVHRQFQKLSIRSCIVN